MSKPNSIVPLIPVPATPECGPSLGACNDAERAFAIARVHEGLDQTDAARAAGYSGDKRTLAVMGSRLAHRPKVAAAILELSIELIRSHGASSIRKLIHLRDHATDERVQLRACESILDRCGGLSSAQVFQHEITVTHNLSLADLQAQRLRLEKELGITTIGGPPIIEGEYTDVVEPKPEPEPEPLSDDPHNVNRRETNARRKNMTPEEIEADMAKVELERVEKLKVQYRNAQEYRAAIADADEDLADLF